MTQKNFRCILHLAVIAVIFAPRAEALDLTEEMKDVGCFDFSLADSPENLPGAPATNKTERWCYANFDETSAFRQFIFNADSPKIKPELAKCGGFVKIRIT